jgi:uncharacterized membrane protein
VPRTTLATKPAPGRSTPVGLPNWALPASLGLGVLGLALSIYLTIEHYTSNTSLACPATSTVNCQRVTTSAESVVLGIPVAVLGLVFFVAMIGLCLPQVWSMPDPRLWRIRLAVAGVGLLFAVYLIFVEIFIVNAICLWCTFVHVVAFALFAVVTMATALADPNPFDPKR